MKFIVIVGLPGSGKTMLGKSLLEKDGVLLDDVSNNGGLEAIEKYTQAKATQIIITDPHLCRNAAREFAATFFARVAPEYNIEWIFFENDPEACMVNIRNRLGEGDARSVGGTLRKLAEVYIVPENGQSVPIWRKF